MLLKRNNFSKKLNYYILEGSKNQKEKDFRKSAAICGYAIIFSSVVPIKDWNKQVFDRVIKEGHAFYDSCLTELIRRGRIIFSYFHARKQGFQNSCFGRIFSFGYIFLKFNFA
jgi:hypothetical protein